MIFSEHLNLSPRRTDRYQLALVIRIRAYQVFIMRSGKQRGSSVTLRYNWGSIPWF
jgi:hypothetical protein